MNFWEGKKVCVTGGAGFLGSHLVDALREYNCDLFIPRSLQYDLRYIEDVERMFKDAGTRDVLFNLAANVGGIGYNREHPYVLFHDNITMGVNVIHHAMINRVGKLVQVGTVCAYPKHCLAPFDERNLWDGYPEETNAFYGLAKKMLLVQLQAARAEYGFNGIYLLPTNLYGPRDEFDPKRSHVIPALIRKCLEARNSGANHVEVWGTGRATRDFLYVEDCVEALLLAAERYDRLEPLNIGSGQEVTIAALLHYIQGIVGFQGNTVWDSSQPDGQPRRVLNTSRAKFALGWTARTSLLDGLKETVRWYERQSHKERTAENE